ncbi:MAG: DUF3040 domain-containing protein [Acidimicrobiales bacterium]|nr:DUF3040 domain-containing protein [Acidimicrobiales bacterium]
MPLSEDEQRILSEIEARLYETDPALARDIADTTIYTVAKRRLVAAIVGFLVGLAVLIATLSLSPWSYWLGFVGFVIMVVAFMSIESSLRTLGRAGLDQLAQSMKASGLRDAVGGTRQRMRERFRRGEPDE